MKGGVAKTTLAINVAHDLTRNGRRVLVIDVDPQFNATQCLIKPEVYEKHLNAGKDSILDIFEASAKATASTVTGKTLVKSKSLQTIVPIKTNAGFDLLPGNLNLYKMEMPAGGGRENRLKIFVEHLKTTNNYDYVIIDTPPTPSVWMTSALLASDFYLIPVKPDPISFTGIDLLKSVVEDKKENFGLNIKCIGIVMTIVEESTKVYSICKQYLEKDPDHSKLLFKRMLLKRTEIAREQMNHKLILDSQDADSRLALAGITSELRKRLGDK